MADARANGAVSTVAVAPSPQSSGVTLSVTTGHGGRFPAPPFNCIAAPPSWDGDPTLYEIVRVTAMSGDNVTAMTRAQESTTARAIDVGWSFVAPVTKKMIDDLEFTQMLPTSAGWPNLATLASGAPAAPAAGVTLFGRSIAGRHLPAIVGPAGVDTSLQPFLARNKIRWISPVANTATASANGYAVTAVGTATAAAPATTNMHQSLARIDYLVGTAATTAVAGWRVSQPDLWRGNAARLGGFHVVIRWGPATGATVATRRAFVGLSPGTTAPTDVNPSTLVNISGMGWDAGDTNVQMFFNDGTGAATKIDLGVARAGVDRTSVYELALFAAPNSSAIQWAVQDLTTETQIGSGTQTTDLPANTTFLGPRGYCSVGGTSSVVGLAFMGCYVETDL